VDKTITACFDTRRGAETAVEHLVQELGIDRSDVFIAAAGDANTSGVRPAGADAKGTNAKPKLSGPIEVSVDCNGDNSSIVTAALEKAGATHLRAD
jgi:hypothetical protein